MFLTVATPNKHLLSATNGLMATIVAIQHMVGSSAVALLFAFLLTNNVLGFDGNFTYIVLLLVMDVGIVIVIQLLQ